MDRNCCISNFSDYSLFYFKWFVTPTTKQQQKLAAVKTGHGWPATPSHLPDWNVVVDAQHRISGSVNYGHGAVSKKSRRDHSPLCSSMEDRQRGRGGSKWQKCNRTTIREPLAKCEGSSATGWALLCNPEQLGADQSASSRSSAQGHWLKAHSESQIIQDWMNKHTKKNHVDRVKIWQSLLWFVSIASFQGKSLTRCGGLMQYSHDL